MERQCNSPPSLLRSLSQRGESLTNGQLILDMESVVATVSGYHGSDRFNLIKLISHSGASYVGKMSRSITHLVCWKYEGRKYELAKKFKTVIINHKWIEDCIAQGKRVSEDPYILKCGKEVGSILLEVPHGGLSTKKHAVLCDKSNIDDCRKTTMNMKPGDSRNDVFSESCLLTKDLFFNCGTVMDTFNKKLKGASILEHEKGSSSKYYCQEPPISEIVKNDGHPTQHSMRSAKIKNANCYGRTATESSRKRRRLIKKNISVNALKSIALDVNASSSSAHSAGGNNDAILVPKRNSNIQLCQKRKFENDLERVHDIEESDNQYASSQSNTSTENRSTAITSSSNDGLSFVDASEEPIKVDAQTQHTTVLSTAEDLSCVICWTDFSSTRGILPCGHRFCYSCIQNWADHMASMRKVSTCPLCKANFLIITKIEDAATFDQKIYSQTIPCDISTVDMLMVADPEAFGARICLPPVCTLCQCREPEDLLLTCNVCESQHVHSYCLDPPLLPWTCLHCKDLQMLFHPTY